MDMYSSPEIFLVTTVFLVPFLYYATSIPNACAVPPDPKYLNSLQCTTSDDGKLRVSCCWKEGEKTYCQTCAAPGGKYDCGPVNEYLPSSRPQLEGGVLQPSTPFSPIDPKSGVLEQLQDNDLTFSGDSNKSNDTLARYYIKEPGKVEFPNLKILPNATKSENGEEIDEKETTIKDNGQAGPQENASTMEKEQKKPLTTFLEKNLNNAKDLPSQLKMVKQVKDPYKKLVLLTGIMEEQGKVPPETTKALNSVLQGDANALDELCNILSTDQGTNVAADICTAFPEQCDNVRASMIEYALVAIVISIAEVLLK